MIRVHRLLFVIAVAAGLVSNFSHVHGLSVFLRLSTSSNPDFEKNMDLTLIDVFVTQGTKFKLCALVFQRINDLCPPLYHLSPVVNQATTRPSLYHPSTVVNQATTRPQLYHPSPVVNQAPTPPPLCQPSPVVAHPSTIVSTLSSGQSGDHPSTSPLPCGQPGDHPSNIVSTLPVVN